jgi:lysozyme
LDVAEPAAAASEPSAEPTLAEVAEAEAVAASDTEVAAMVVEPSEPQTPAKTTGPALPSAIGLRFSPYANVVVGPLLGIGGGMSAAAPASDETAAPAAVEPLAVEAVAETPAESSVVSEPVVEAETVAADYAAHSSVEVAPGLVLTAPDERDPPIIRPAWTDAERDFTADEQSRLFEEPLQIAPGAILRHEVIAAPRRTDWSETGAFVAMGGIGLVSFGAAMAAFRRAGEQQSGGDQTAVVGWVLALIALICVGVSGYNLFRHWTSERQSD